MKTKIVGILNISPESFSGDGLIDRKEIIDRALQMVKEGADCLDIGAQSTKSGSVQLSLEEESIRLKGLIKEILRQSPYIEVSIDTTRREIAGMCLEEGATTINDISGGHFDEQMISLVRDTKSKYILTHSQGDFSGMHDMYKYKDVVGDIISHFEKEIAALEKKGISRDKIIIDPGIGFSKAGKQNFEIIKGIERLHAFGCPIYVGLSRKKFIGTTIGVDDPAERDNGTSALHIICMQKGVSYIRTHNVPYTKQCVQLLEALK